MVRCMFNGVTWDTNEGKNLTYVCPDDDFDYINLETKVIEDEFDNKGRPLLKIIYQDAGDWSPEYVDHHEYFARMIAIKERPWYTRMKSFDPFIGPRLIFVLQDKDFWPGSKSDPNAMKRRIWKEIDYIKKKKRYPRCHRPDYKYLSFSNEVDFIESESSEDGALILKQLYALIYNPNLPGAKFVYENLNGNQRQEMESIQKLIFESSALDTMSELEDSKRSGGIKKTYIHGREIVLIKREVQETDGPEDIDALLKEGFFELSISEKERKASGDLEELSYQSSMSDIKMEDWEVIEQYASSDEFECY